MGVTAGGFPRHNYYPHVEKPEEAQRITIAAGDEKPGIDLTVALPPFGPQLLGGAPPPRTPPPEPRGDGSGVIRGRVVRADGVPVRRARVHSQFGGEPFHTHSRADRRRWSIRVPKSPGRDLSDRHDDAGRGRSSIQVNLQTPPADGANQSL